MTSAHYVILGGGVAGTTAAETIRRRDPHGSIVIITAENECLYSRVLLPHFVKGLIPEERLYLRKKEWYEEQQIVLRGGVRAKAIDPLEKIVTLNTSETIHYDTLLIATGGEPNTWNIPGGDAPSILPLWTIDHARKMRYLLTRTPPPTHGVAIGGGFICTDLVPIFRHFNMHTTVIIREPHMFWGLLDEESAGIIEHAMIEQGVSILHNEEVVQVHRETQKTSLLLQSGRSVQADLVGLGIGLHPESGLFRSAGLNVKDGGIETNEYLASSLPDIWAAGDVAVFYDVHVGLSHKVGNWTNAQAQGRVAGANMIGRERQSFHLVSAYTVQLFNCSVTFLGDVEMNPDVEAVVVGDIGQRQRTRLLFYGKYLIGATMINMPHLRVHLVRLIEQHIDASPYRATLERGDYTCLCQHSLPN